MYDWLQEEGIYLGTVVDWGLRTSKKKQTPYFFLAARMTHKMAGLVPLPDPFITTAELWLTEKARPYTLSDLHQLGFEGEDLERLHPGAADAHDFTGLEVLFSNTIQVHPQFGPDERWRVLRPRLDPKTRRCILAQMKVAARAACGPGEKGQEEPGDTHALEDAAPGGERSDCIASAPAAEPVPASPPPPGEPSPAGGQQDAAAGQAEGSPRTRGRRARKRKQTQAEFWDEVYTRFLGALTLSDEDRAFLREREFPDEVIDRNGYKSLAVIAASQAAARLFAEYGDRLLRVPGFVRLAGRVCPAYRMGLLVPLRDCHGRISGCLVYEDLRCGGTLFAAYSPTRPFAHVALPPGAAGGYEVVRLTEGVLNADLIAHLDPSMPTVGVEDVSRCKAALKVVRELGVKEVRFAFNAGWEKRKDDVRATQEFYWDLGKEFRLSLESWDAGEAKSLGELLAGGGRPRLMTHEMLVAEAERTRETW
jgi:hypothetical protein